MTEPHYCKYCNRNFTFKDIYDNHALTCAFFYKTKREKERDLESFERLPNPQEMYKLVQHLMNECTHLKREVTKLRTNANMRKTRIVVDWLNSSANPIPNIPFLEWTKQFVASRKYLEHVYLRDLTEGIKMMLDEVLLDKVKVLPIRAFTQKPGRIYVYTIKLKDPVLDQDQNQNLDQDQDFAIINEWTSITVPEFEKWIASLSKILLREFCVMQMENKVKIFSNDDEKDKNIIFMMKMNGGKTSDERRAQDIKKWLFTKIEQDIQECEYV